MIDLEFAELHSPLFVAGTNLQPKLIPKNRTGLKLQYDRKHQELHVTWNGKTAIVPRENVACMVEVEKKPAKEAIEMAPAAAPAPVMPHQTKISAQYDTPMSHVFAGPGAGKTGS